jgi:hypothetical protein
MAHALSLVRRCYACMRLVDPEPATCYGSSSPSRAQHQVEGESQETGRGRRRRVRTHLIEFPHPVALPRTHASTCFLHEYTHRLEIKERRAEVQRVPESGGHAAVCYSSFNPFYTRQHVHRHLHTRGDGHLSGAAPPLAHLVINRHIMLARQGVTESIGGAEVTPPACLFSCRIRRATRREP